MFGEITQVKQFHIFTGQVTLHNLDTALMRKVAHYNGNLSAAEVRMAILKGLRVYTSFSWYQAI
jgi:hypothetical protein